MTMDVHNQNKAALLALRQALYDYEPERVRERMQAVFRADAKVFLATPFEQLDGSMGLYHAVFEPLQRAIPDLERRDTIVIAGPGAVDGDWVGCCGYYTGTFGRPWMDIPPTERQVSLRFHEFCRMEDGKVAEMQALWDIPELMLQAGAWRTQEFRRLFATLTAVLPTSQISRSSHDKPYIDHPRRQSAAPGAGSDAAVRPG
jgi:predicted ester cyclase